MVRKKIRRIYGLDGLKTLALIGVLIYHTFPSFLPGGFLGVILFLVIAAVSLTLNKGLDRYESKLY